MKILGPIMLPSSEPLRLFPPIKMFLRLVCLPSGMIDLPCPTVLKAQHLVMSLMVALQINLVNLKQHVIVLIAIIPIIMKLAKVFDVMVYLLVLSLNAETFTMGVLTLSRTSTKSISAKKRGNTRVLHPTASTLSNDLRT